MSNVFWFAIKSFSEKGDKTENETIRQFEALL